ncbi:unnamed protein product [Calicophoron daubneyi]|uniref:Alpha-taxilin n=1 Tax=Calicophoron daubneyi TaxID=300641 RepID=A0AAV2TNF0_CALDB
MSEAEPAAALAVNGGKEKSPTPPENKQRKKKLRAVESVLKDLPQSASDEEKLRILCEKYHDLYQDHKDSLGRLKQCEKLAVDIRRERDQLQSDRNRLVLQKDKLETLCRELQKQNKVIQEENLARTRAEEDKRREVADHFQTSINAIQVQLNEYQNRNMELRKENQELADKLGQFIKEHEKREEHVEKVLQTRTLEVKLAEAKLNKSECLLDQERIKSQQKVARMEKEAKLMKERMDMHLDLEKKLKDQIEFYKTKYQNFNKTVAQSNKLFDSARVEMDKLAKRVHQAECDVVEWRGKWELSQQKLVEVVKEHKKQIEETVMARKQADRLAGLCRALQNELAAARKGEQSGAAVDKPLDGQGDGMPEEVSKINDSEPKEQEDEQNDECLSAPVPDRTDESIRHSETPSEDSSTLTDEPGKETSAKLAEKNNGGVNSSENVSDPSQIKNEDHVASS